MSSLPEPAGACVGSASGTSVRPGKGQDLPGHCDRKLTTQPWHKVCLQKLQSASLHPLHLSALNEKMSSPAEVGMGLHPQKMFLKKQNRASGDSTQVVLLMK